MNGILIHGLDYDDTHMAGVIHVTSSALPLALGECTAVLPLCHEAIRLAGLNGIDLFQYYGVLAVINAPSTDSAIPVSTQTFNGMTKMFGMFALNTRDAVGQDKWHFCPKCQKR